MIADLDMFRRRRWSLFIEVTMRETDVKYKMYKFNVTSGVTESDVS